MHRAAKLILLALVCANVVPGLYAQDDAKIASRSAIEKELESVAIIERKVMVPMRDGKRMQADIYRPKDESKKYPILFSRTPYNFNYWDVALGAPRDMSHELEAVKRGYIYIEMNERGRYFSEGDYDILGTPLTDADDALTWMDAQPWSAAKVGLIGCSSTAEWQLSVATRGDKALTAFVPESFGAGVGRVGPYYEQGNWFRGGAVQMLFIPWVYDSGLLTQDGRPTFPPGMSQQALVIAARSYDLSAHSPPVDWSKALLHLPVKDILSAVGGGHGIFAETTPSGKPGMITRTPNDPAWYQGGLWNDSQHVTVPGLWLMTWYDISVAPNLAAYNDARAHAGSPAVADEQYAIIAPVAHCSYKGASEHTIVGERDMGDARLDYDALTYGWFDHFLKGEDNGALTKSPHVRYYTMGSNRWQSSDTWPPKDAKPVTFYLASSGHANSLYGDGALLPSPAAKDEADQFVYDPLNPVPTLGGGFCCLGNYKAGAVDQRALEARNDILVYSTGPLRQGIEVSGPIDVTLYISSDAKDTDFTVKLVEVLPDGTAYNLDDNIQRVRYREGYNKPPVWMEKDQVYKVTLQPMQTSDYFAPGHQLRIEVSSSNFPRYDRNLNTGGANYDEAQGVVAHNAVHHSARYPSSITLSVVAKEP